ncbi:MAG: hypothetical protein GXO69_03930 [Acidobacteria bacterium]|nr:hypothetical protein [Acidobacteriota bacterium]
MNRFNSFLIRIILILVLGIMSVVPLNAGDMSSLLRVKKENDIRFLMRDKSGCPTDIIFRRSRQYKGKPVDVAKAFLTDYGKDLKIPSDSFSLCHYAENGDETIIWLQQFHEGLPVFYGRAYFVIKNNAVEMFRDSVERIKTGTGNKSPVLSPLKLPNIALAEISDVYTVKEGPDLGYFREKPAYRMVLTGRNRCWEAFFNAETGKLIFKRNMIHESHDGTGMVFHPNPISTTGDISIPDNNDADSEVLDQARMQVTLHLLDDASGKLKNQYVDLTAPGMDSRAVPGYTPGMAQSDTGEFNYTRNDFRFEEVNAYYWITELSRYISGTLGFPERVNYSVPVNVHYMTDDNSYYMETDRGLHFGDGGVDDAEDVEIVLHEFGHAIQHNAIPGLGQTWDAGSQDEGTSDYIAATFSGDTRYPDTIGEWDSISYDPNPDDNPPRLRPIVTDRHYPEDMQEPYPLTGSANIHWDGVIWSSTLWQIRNHIGREQMDSILMKALPTMTPDCHYPTSAARLLNAGISLYGNQYQDTLRYFFTKRGILDNNYIVNPQPGNELFHLYFPFVREDEDMISHIGIVNPEAVDVSYTIQIVGDNGALIYGESGGVVPAEGRVWISPLKAKLQAPCYVLLSSEKQLFGYSAMVSRNLDRSSFLPAVNHLSNSLFIPHIAPESDYWDTKTSIVNVSDQIPLVSYQTPGEDSISVEGLNTKYGEIYLNWLTDIYDGEFPAGFPGWGTLTADMPVLAGVETFRKKGDNIEQLSGFSLSDQTVQTLYFPHVDVEKGYWWTGIAMENVSDNSCQLTLTPYDSEGNQLESLTLELAGKSKLVDLVQNIWENNGATFPAGTAWIKAETENGRLVGFELFGTLEQKGDRLLAGVQGGTVPSTDLIFPHVTADPAYWTGIAFVNTAESPCSVTIDALNDSGDILMSLPLENPLNPNGKYVSVAADIFPGGLPEGTTQIRVHGDQTMVGFELWGNLNPRQDYISGMAAFSSSH